MKYFSILKIFISPLFGILLLAGMLTACCYESGNGEDPTPDPPVVTGPTERAVLVYMLADNSLGRDGYDTKNLNEMIRAAADGLLHGNRLLVYHDDWWADHPILKEVTPNGLKEIKAYDNSALSTSRERMEQAIADFKGVAEADCYGLIFWSHASGWPLANEVTSYAGAGGATPMWVGEDSGNYMDVTDLHEVLAGKGFDYIYFDCCLMASIEALYEIRDVADYFVASAAELPAEGMPYYQALPYLMAKDADLVEAARATFTKYDSLTGSDRTSTISVIDAAALEPLAEATGAIYQLHPELSSGYSVQKFERPKSNGGHYYFYDFKDYVDNLQFTETAPSVAAWNKALEDAVVFQAATPWIFNTISVAHHCGLTTYILRRPSDALNKGYCNLRWYHNVASRLYD